MTTGIAPALTSFAPALGGIGASVTIKGTNFAGATAVKFNGTSATFKMKGPSQIAAVVPAGATTGPITVTTAGGTAASASDFTVVPAPAIAGFTPDSGNPGTAVTISGSDFAGASSVMFNGSKAAFTVVSTTEISAVVPKGAKTGPVSVSTPGGTAASASNFIVTK